MARQHSDSNEVYSSSHGRKRRGKDKALVVVSILLIIISVLVVGVAVLMNTSLLGGSEGKIDSELYTPTEIRDKVVNFLVCGIDDELGRGLGERTDVIMVASLNLQDGEVSVLQLPRDTYIPENYNTNKINAVYGSETDGGIDGLAKVVYSNFGVTLDHYVTINMDGVRSMVDAVNGVEVNVPVSFSLDGVTIEAGPQTLDGKQALAVCRERSSYAAADIARMQTQRLVLAALVSKMLAMPKTDLISMVPTLAGYVNTDLTINQMLGFVDATDGVEMEDITMYLLPGESVNRGLSYYTMYKDEVVELLNQRFFPFSDKITEDDIGCVELDNTGISRGKLNFGNFGSIDGTDSGRGSNANAGTSDNGNVTND